LEIKGASTIPGYAYTFGIIGLFVWLVADGWCWFVLREKYCWLIAGGWFVLREKYCWLVADKPSEQAAYGLLISNFTRFCIFQIKVYTFSTHSLWTAYGVLMDF
jgi:hypothetical protein